MKIFLITIGLSLGVGAHAASDLKFEEHKKQALEGIEKRISAMQEHKTCVSAAQDEKAFKACHEKMREFHHDMRADHLKMRKQRIDKKMEKLEDH